jgi:prefoldin subunit 5
MGNSSSTDNAENTPVITQEDLDAKNNEISELSRQINNLKSQINELQSEIEELTESNDTIPDLTDQISSLTDELETKQDVVDSLTQELEELKAEYEKKQSEIETTMQAEIKKKQSEIETVLGAKDKTITNLNKDIATYKSCTGANDKLIIALRRYQSATGFVKMLFDNKDWLMYIVDDFDKNWRNHKWFKYIWNIAFTFKNTSRVIILFGSRNNGISPVRSPANFKSINKGFITALAIDPQMTAYNMNTVITNPLLASTYDISFWGAHRQKKGDDTSYTYVKTLQHDQTGNERHKNLNQTTWMWNWMNTVAYDPKKYPNVKATEKDISQFTDKGRIVTQFVFKYTKPDSEQAVAKVEGMYTKRPTAAG